MAHPNFVLDSCDLAPAAVDSRGHLQTLLRDLIEAAPVALEGRLLARLLLPSEDRYIRVFRIKLQPVADAIGRLGGRERRPAAQERVIHQLTPLRVVEERAPHQLNWFLRRMIEF